MSVAAPARSEPAARRRPGADRLGRRLGGYSGGIRQRLGSAQAIVDRPRVLLLDELVERGPPPPAQALSQARSSTS